MLAAAAAAVRCRCRPAGQATLHLLWLIITVSFDHITEIQGPGARQNAAFQLDARDGGAGDGAAARAEVRRAPITLCSRPRATRHSVATWAVLLAALPALLSRSPRAGRVPRRFRPAPTSLWMPRRRPPPLPPPCRRRPKSPPPASSCACPSALTAWRPRCGLCVCVHCTWLSAAWKWRREWLAGWSGCPPQMSAPFPFCRRHNFVGPSHWRAAAPWPPNSCS